MVLVGVMVLVVLALGSITSASVDVRIVGGTDVVPGSYPFLTHVRVLYHRNGVMYAGTCAGALIDRSWVLTAGHCTVINENFLRYWMAKSIDVWVGAHDIDDATTGFFTKVDRIAPHPFYYDNENDLALLHLSKPVDTNLYPPAKLPGPGNYSQYYTEGTQMTIAGWGKNSFKGGETSNVPHQALMPLVGKKACMEQLDVDELFATICAGHPNGKTDACQGDSGGPMFTTIDGDHVIFGLISWGKGCARANRPGVYTKVAAYHDWIKKTIQMDSDDVCEGTCATCNGKCSHCKWAMYSSCDLFYCSQTCNVAEDLGNGVCDDHCNSVSCHYDRGDCATQDTQESQLFPVDGKAGIASTIALRAASYLLLAAVAASIL